MIVPYVERAVPVIADVRVDPAFGSGALKITPGHDPLDFEIGRDHGLPEPMVIGLDGRMSDQAGDLAGLTQAEADAAVVAWVKERGWLVKRENYRHAVGHLRAVPLADRAADLAAVVVPDGRACAAGDRSAARPAGSLPPGVAAPVRDRVARQTPGLVPVAAALVGAPAARSGTRPTERRSARRRKRRRKRKRGRTSR